MDSHHAGQVTAPRDFHHPYTPYAIQETFMSTVYEVLGDGKVGILESPTGTVSLISFRDRKSHVCTVATLLPLNFLKSRVISLFHVH